MKNIIFFFLLVFVSTQTLYTQVEFRNTDLYKKNKKKLIVKVDPSLKKDTIIAPPNGIKIKDNFYCDKTEASNMMYMEYLDWLYRIFGKESKEHKEALPDESVWNHKVYRDNYLRHPAYANYPIVGITQKQAENYSKWRSDQVFEGFLIKKGIIIDNHLDATKYNYFTIEKYFKGYYAKTKKDTTIKYYPKFSLPTKEEREIIEVYSDSINIAFYNSKKIPKNFRDCSKHNYSLVFDNKTKTTIPPKKNFPYRIFNECTPPKGINFLEENVSEWLEERGLCIGSNWRDEENIENEIRKTEAPNAWVGFRNVCEWVEYEPK